MEMLRIFDTRKGSILMFVMEVLEIIGKTERLSLVLCDCSIKITVYCLKYWIETQSGNRILVKKKYKRYVKRSQYENFSNIKLGRKC